MSILRVTQRAKMHLGHSGDYLGAYGVSPLGVPKVDAKEIGSGLPVNSGRWED